MSDPAACRFNPPGVWHLSPPKMSNAWCSNLVTTTTSLAPPYCCASSIKATVRSSLHVRMPVHLLLSSLASRPPVATSALFVFRLSLRLVGGTSSSVRLVEYSSSLTNLPRRMRTDAGGDVLSRSCTKDRAALFSLQMTRTLTSGLTISMPTSRTAAARDLPAPKRPAMLRSSLPVYAAMSIAVMAPRICPSASSARTNPVCKNQSPVSESGCSEIGDNMRSRVLVRVSINLVRRTSLGGSSAVGMDKMPSPPGSRSGGAEMVDRISWALMVLPMRLMLSTVSVNVSLIGGFATWTGERHSFTANCLPSSASKKGKKLETTCPGRRTTVMLLGVVCRSLLSSGVSFFFLFRVRSCFLVTMPTHV